MVTASSLRWRREGLLVRPRTDHPWWTSHAQSPTVLPISDRLWRIYFAGRDKGNQSRIMAVDVDPADDMRLTGEHLDPVLELGPPGTFDHGGIGPSAALHIDGQVRLYYTGVTVRQDVRSQMAIGVAFSDDGLSFQRAVPGPVLSTGPFDPIFSGAPCLVRTAGNYRMWYTSGTHWQLVSGNFDSFYEIRTSISEDGIVWDPRSKSAVPLRPGEDAGLARPWIVSAGDRATLWFSRRGTSFRTSGEGAYRLVSTCIDAEGRMCGPVEPVLFENPPSPEDFDSWMQAYCCIVPLGRDLIMFYNGNDFGRSGFGWARLPGGTELL